MVDIGSIIDALHDLDDGDLTDIIDVARQIKHDRQHEASARALHGIRVDDRVRISMEGLKPKYMEGATGTVVEKRVTKVGVRLDEDIHDPYGKWAGRIAIMPAANVTKIEED